MWKQYVDLSNLSWRIIYRRFPHSNKQWNVWRKAEDKLDKNTENVWKFPDTKAILVPLLLRTEVECEDRLLYAVKTRSRPTYCQNVPLQNISDYFFYTAGLFIFSIRVDSYDPAGLGYSDKCVELEKTGKWSLVCKENREVHAAPNEERFRYCYLITYKILKWKTVFKTNELSLERMKLRELT